MCVEREKERERERERERGGGGDRDREKGTEREGGERGRQIESQRVLPGKISKQKR